MAHLRAVPDPDDDPVAGLPVDPAAALTPGEDETHTPYAGEADDDHGATQGETRGETHEEPRRYPSTIGGAFYLCILAAAATALVIATRDDWRLGVQILGGALVAAALLRLLLTNRDAGMLAVRNRFLDAFLLMSTGAALIVLATSIPDMPLT